MARDLETRYLPEPPVPLRGGFEVHFVEYHHIDVDHRNDGWRSISMLINFIDSPDARTTFSAIRHAFVSARCSSHVFDEVEGIARLRLHLQGMTFDSLDAVIFAEDSADVTFSTLEEIVDAVPADSRGLVVVVGQECRGFEPARGISGFVRGASGTSPAIAMSVFVLLAALSAPHTTICLDHDEVLATLGTADQPAVLVEAIWLRDQRRLVYPGTGDGLVIRQASVITCNLVAAALRMAEVVEMMKAVRAEANPDCSISYQAPVDAMTTPYLHRAVALIPMICRLDEVRPGELSM